MKIAEKPPLIPRRASYRIPKHILDQLDAEVTVIPDHDWVGVVAINAGMLERLVRMAKEDKEFFNKIQIMVSPY